MNWTVKCALIDHGSLADILYYDVYEKLQLDIVIVQPFKGLLVGFSGEHVVVRGYISLNTIFGTGKNSKTVRVGT